MKTSAGRAMMLSLCVLAALLPGQASARLTAIVDRTEVAIGETLRLTLSGDAGERPDSVDLTTLDRDFEILARSTATNARLVNGSREVTRTLELELAPRREGLVTIPSFNAGGRASTPIAIKVAAAPDIDAGDALVLFDAELDRDNVYVQAQVLLTLTLQQAINLDQRQVDSLDLPGADVQALEQRSFQRQINGRLWQVIELRYAIFPQQSGTLEIPSLAFSGREILPGRSLLGARLGRRLEIRTDAATVVVKPVPDSFPGSVWLPARDLRIDEQWSKDPASLTLGDSTTRTLDIAADGLMGAQLPPVDSLDPQQQLTGLRLYPGEESIDQSETDLGLRGLRTQREALVPNQAGNWSLPERRLPWWNTETDRLEYATLPARIIDVSFAAASPQSPGPMIDVASTSSGSRLYDSSPAILIGGGLGWLLALLFAALWWSVRPRKTAPVSDDIPSTERAALIALRLACQQRSPVAVRQSLLDWARQRFSPAIISLADIKVHAGEGLASKIDELNRAMYTEADDAWDPQGLLHAVRDTPRARDNTRSSGIELYPEGV